MKFGVLVFLLLLTVFPIAVFAQQSNTKAAMTVNQREGRRIYQQKCAMCHVPATATARTLGPGLSKAMIEADEDAMRGVIMNGRSNTMPGFKYTLTTAQVGNIIDFLKTLDSPPHVLSSERPER